MTAASSPTAALLIIGNEILSGRTQDVNLAAVARSLLKVGIPLQETRVVADIESEIIAALNVLRARYTYVFTTGGIGPTHDDITVDSVAKAFGVGVVEHPEARKLLAARYEPQQLTSARLRMARVPAGATLVVNPVSAAPGMKIENVFVLAGVPEIMQAMLDGIIPALQPGPAIHSQSVSGLIGESMIAEELAAIAARYSHIDIGSYPFVRDNKFGTTLVARGTDKAAVEKAADEIAALLQTRKIEISRSAA